MPTLHKEDFFTELSEKLGYSRNDVKAIIEGGNDHVVETLKSGRADKVQITGFGAFTVKSRTSKIRQPIHENGKLVGNVVTDQTRTTSRLFFDDSKNISDQLTG